MRTVRNMRKTILYCFRFLSVFSRFSLYCGKYTNAAKYAKTNLLHCFRFLACFRDPLFSYSSFEYRLISFCV